MDHCRYWSCKPWQLVYKKVVHYPSIPKSKCSISLQDFHSPLPVFTVMLYKPLVALFMAFAATGGVAASTTPVRRGGGGSVGGSYPPPPGPTIRAYNCDSNNNLSCCQSLTSTNNPYIIHQLGLGPLLALLNIPVGPDTLAGVKCNSIGLLNNNPTW